MLRRRLATGATLAGCTLLCGPLTGIAGATGPTTYAANTPVVTQITGGPWTLAQGDPTVGAPYSQSLPTYTPGGTPTSAGGVPNVAVYPGASSPPYASGVTGTPGPLPGYCGAGGPNPESGAVNRQPAGTTLPMSPYYFPHIVGNADGSLTGYFDYRPKDSNEAVVTAKSTDRGQTWTFEGQALELNQGSCPNANTVDDGQGHPFTLTINGTTYLYTLNRAHGDTPGTNLIVHTLHPVGDNPLAGLPSSEPIGQGGSTTTTATVTIPAGPGGPGVTVPVASTTGFESGAQIIAGGATADCAATTAASFTGCVTTTPAGAPAPVTVASGATVTAPPIVPAGAQATNGLNSPDGILGVLPSSTTLPGEPAGATAILYIDKEVSYAPFIPTTVASAVSLPVSTLPLASMPFTTFPITVSVGSSVDVQHVTCTGASGNSLTGCSGGTGAVAAGAEVGAPNACSASYANTLSKIGEGGNSKKKIAALYANNEDYAAVAAAYTTDGINFTPLLAPVTGLADPNSATGLRWASPGGTVITNPDGSLGIFYSAGSCSDGDSDAFNSVFYSTSTDGITWSSPTVVSSTDALNPQLSTDYTFKAAVNQHTSGGPLDVSGYYSGRIYSPSVVQNSDGTLTMVFAGYRTPKPLPSDGTAIGTGSPQYVVASTDPALYRNIMTVQLGKDGPPPQTPEAPLVILLPISGLALGGIGYGLMRRRRPRPRTAA